MSQKYPLRASDVAYRLVDGEAILVSAGQGTIYTLNSVGAMVWNLADGTASVNQIAEEIGRNFPVEPEPARADALEFLESLQGKGILELFDQPQGPKPVEGIGR